MNKTPFPPEIEELILKRQVEAGNKADITVFYKDPWATDVYFGFNWTYTPEKDNFWKEVLAERNYKPFYDKYPQSIKFVNGTSSSTTQQYKGQIAGYPKEVVDLALDRIINCELIPGKTKLECLEIKGVMGTIDWIETPEGVNFWSDINCKNFETFYKLYPKDTQTLTNEKTRSKDEQISSIDGEQGIKGSSHYRASNQARKTTTSSGYRGDIVQNRVVANRFAKCEISIEIE